jgi:hypothetical protein
VNQKRTSPICFVPTEKYVDVSREEFEERMTAARQETEDLRSTLTAVIEGQTTVIEGLVEKLQGQNAVNERQSAVIETLKDENLAMKQQIERLVADPKHDEDPVQVAFSAVSHEYFGSGEVDTNIPFEVVYVNIGGGWSPTGNAFMANVAGFYEFTASIVCAGNSDAHVYGHIVHSYGINLHRAKILVRHN